jgi:hypothetical protein
MKNNYFAPLNSAEKEMDFGKWHVSETGDMCYDNGRYDIYDNQLTDHDWILHMFEKSWIDWNEFIPAYFKALKNAGIQFKKERIFY